ncbi:hypothetical protein [Brachybacterium sp. p3-SID957]|uniref:hypothetical protein n=1 Tax=Brachybacterium sp. p3-SID957 TaxID=2916049 RepID=UPI00223A7989|nr:hypothetical protein [Brachybacterium sp. p3-SID957]MCT1776222.1 hypothetical protein [Brachybacterium sp. p3-SID957]
MFIDVILDRTAVPIDEDVFTTLLENSVAGTYKVYERALEKRIIKFSDLMFLASRGDIPYSLFFAPLPHVREQVRKKTDKLLAGVSRDTFSIGSRSKVELRDVELIVKDLIRKQQLVRKHDPSLERNKLVGLLQRPGPSVDADAARLSSALGLSHEMLRTCRSKADALDLMIERLEANQVLVSQSVQHHMPQRLTHVKFSGMSIRDNKVPYIFLAGGDHGDDQEPTGRTIFTLTLMTVLVARRIFAPMTWDGGSTETDPGREYDIAGAMLMPTERMKSINPTTLDDMRAASDQFKVTPSAVTVRAMRLGLVSGKTASGYLDELREEFRRKPTGGPRNKILPENAVRKYAGREFTQRMLHALDSMSITPGEFCRTVCLNQLRPTQLGDLRRAVG